MNTLPVFDMRHYDRLNPARAGVAREMISTVKAQVGLQTALDVGCGLGYFSAFLHSLGFEVTGVDGRTQNAEEARRRVPQVRFYVMNAEDPALRSLGRFDLVLCFGLLYHLENPFLTVRHLQAMTSQLLLVEGVIFPGSKPIMGLVDEGRSEDQALNHIAFYPTEACLVKMMYRAGFPNVYQFARAPEHEDYAGTRSTGPIRTMLAASYSSLQTELLKIVAEPKLPFDPWAEADAVRECEAEERRAKEAAPLQRIRRFVNKPLPDKFETIKRVVRGR